jgi:hypothetical protein
MKNSRVDNKYGIDPNTKHIWEGRMATYIEEYCFNMFDIESVQRALAYRPTVGGKKHNCDITISNMLALEHMVDNKHLGIDVSEDNPDEEYSMPLSGFYEFEGEMRSVSDDNVYEDIDGFYT